MSITLEATQLKSAVAKVAPLVAGSKISNPVVENIILRAGRGAWNLDVEGTNLSISIRATLALEEAVETPVEIAVCPVKLKKVIDRYGKGDLVTLSVADKKLTVAKYEGNSSCGIAGIDLEDFPPIIPWRSLEESVSELSATGASLGKILKQTGFCATDELHRFQLGGIKIECEEEVPRFIATDGRRMSIATAPCEVVSIKWIYQGEGGGYLLPSVAADHVARLLKGSKPDPLVSIFLAPKRAWFEWVERDGPVMTLATTLMEDNFPPYRHIPHILDCGDVKGGSFHRLTFDQAELLAGVKEGSLFTDKRGLIDLSYSAEETDYSLRIESDNAEGDSSEAVVPIAAKLNYGAPLFRLSACCKYLIEYLSVLEKGETVDLIVYNLGKDCDSSAFYFRTRGLVHCLMPMTVKDRTEPKKRPQTRPRQSTRESRKIRR